MSMYLDQHPLTKQAAYAPLGAALKSLRGLRAPGALKNLARRYAPEAAAGVVGVSGGAYLGNKAYDASLPQVKSLPRLYHEEMVQPQNQGATWPYPPQ